MPSACASGGVSAAIDAPPTESDPASGDSAPLRILMSVELPAPFSPTIACTSPACRSNETSRSARAPANDLVMDVASRRFMGRPHGQKGRKAEGQEFRAEGRKAETTKAEGAE